MSCKRIEIGDIVRTTEKYSRRFPGEEIHKAKVTDATCHSGFGTSSRLLTLCVNNKKEHLDEHWLEVVDDYDPNIRIGDKVTISTPAWKGSLQCLDTYTVEAFYEDTNGEFVFIKSPEGEILQRPRSCVKKAKEPCDIVGTIKKKLAE